MFNTIKLLLEKWGALKIEPTEVMLGGENCGLPKTTVKATATKCFGWYVLKTTEAIPLKNGLSISSGTCTQGWGREAAIFELQKVLVRAEKRVKTT